MSAAESVASLAAPGDGGAGVPRATFAETTFAKRRRTSRDIQRDEKERRVVEAVRGFIRRRRLRPSVTEICAAAGISLPSFSRLVGAPHLVMTRIAREHWQEVAAAVGIAGLDEVEQRRLVWLLLVGKPREILAGDGTLSDYEEGR